jgi:CDP-glycerol glycerophosphotransferase (TagB/SpsB family)
MTRDDVVQVANILAHSDVVITPGSTITLEAAIFDRPTIVPIFHTYQPERAHDYFSTWVLGKHFGRIEEMDLVPIIRKGEDFVPAIRRCLSAPEWYREQRAKLVKEYVQFTDGRSTERIFNLALQIAGNGK